LKPNDSEPDNQDVCITQFLDIGSGFPQGDSVHEVALREVPDARVVYVDRDPVVLAHANELLRGTPEGLVSYVYGGLRDPELILREAAKTLDFSRPAAALLFGILHFFGGADDPAGLVGQLMAPLAPGSCLALTHLASDLHSEELSETFNRLNPPWPSRSRCAAAVRWRLCSAAWA
jgi:S-adenosyl methyltransferase